MYLMFVNLSSFEGVILLFYVLSLWNVVSFLFLGERREQMQILRSFYKDLLFKYVVHG